VRLPGSIPMLGAKKENRLRGWAEIMAKLQPYIGGQTYRTVRQHDTTQVLDRLTGQLQAWDKQQQEQEAFDEKIKNIDMQNKTNSAIVNYKSDLKILNDSFDPNSQTPQDHKEKQKNYAKVTEKMRRFKVISMIRLYFLQLMGQSR